MEHEKPNNKNIVSHMICQQLEICDEFCSNQMIGSITIFHVSFREMFDVEFDIITDLISDLIVFNFKVK